MNLNLRVRICLRACLPLYHLFPAAEIWHCRPSRFLAPSALRCTSESVSHLLGNERGEEHADQTDADADAECRHRRRRAGKKNNNGASLNSETSETSFLALSIHWWLC